MTEIPPPITPYLEPEATELTKSSKISSAT